MSYDIPYMWNLRRNDTKWTYSQNRKKMNLWLPVHTAIFKMDNQQESTA